MPARFTPTMMAFAKTFIAVDNQPRSTRAGFFIHTFLMDDKLQQEAKEKWGNTEAFKQSEERVKKIGPLGLAKVVKEQAELLKEIAAAMPQGPNSDVVQKLIARHYEGLKAFYEPDFKMYRGLADMYVTDPRFKEFYDKVAPGLAEFMREAMNAYADMQEKKS